MVNVPLFQMAPPDSPSLPSGAPSWAWPCCKVRRLRRAVAAAFAAKGYPIALHATLGNGIEVFMVDTIDLYGHMIEFYAPTKELMAIHGFVREQAIGWDGSDPIRSMNF